MVEGEGSRDFSRAKAMMFDRPDLMERLLDKLIDSVAAYLNGQIAAGAQAVMLFDTWGGLLSPRDYLRFSLEPMQKIIAKLTREADGRRVPVVVFTKGGGQWLESMADCGADALGIDWTTDIGNARERVGHQVALQGNMDPNVLYASQERIREEVASVLAAYGSGDGHVFNLGHGIHPGINPEHVAALVQAVRELSPAYHLPV
jgi:uroporphyrinogen decarboxylase